MSKRKIKNIFGLNPVTTGHAGRFPSGWGWKKIKIISD
jgi:hypothetical protein